MALRPSFSFVHVADLHLDTPFSGVHAVAPHVADSLRDASLRAFDAVVDLAIGREVAFVLVAGDIYDGAERGLRAQLRFRDGLARLAEAGIAAFVVHGNHDPIESGWSALGDHWPEGVTVFSSSEVVVVPVVRGGEQIATVQGISYPRRDVTENLARRFSRPEGDGVHIGLLHCNVEGSPGAHANYAPCGLADLRATRLDYLALGHVHERRILSRGAGAGDPWVVYPGNVQARNPRERGAKGAYLVEVVEGVVTEPEFIACDRLRFADVEVEVGHLGDLAELESELRELAEETRRDAPERSLVLRATLIGRGGLHADLARPGALDELLAHLRDDRLVAEPFIWWDALEDATAPEHEERGDLGDFASDLVEIATVLADDVALRAELAAIVAAAPRALQRLADVVVDDATGREELLATARRIALHELGEG